VRGIIVLFAAVAAVSGFASFILTDGITAGVAVFIAMIFGFLTVCAVIYDRIVPEYSESEAYLESNAK
jgi:hypothetical protein